MKKLFVVLVMLVAMNASGQWQSDVRLTNASEGSHTSYNNAWCVAANGNVVHAVWFDHRDGNTEIYYKRSTNGGINWGEDFRLTNNIAYSQNPSIAVSGSNVHMIWHEGRDGNTGEIYYKRSTDGGVIWGVDTRLTNNIEFSLLPSIAVSGSNVHVVWLDYRDSNYEIYYNRSTDGGINWGADTRLTNNNGTSLNPSIAVSGSLVHVVWNDNFNGNNEIYYKRSTDSGISWGAETRLTNNTAWSEFPSIAVSGLNVHIVWYEWGNGNWEIYCKRSTDSGITWGADTRLTNDTVYTGFPSIAVSSSNVHIVWNVNRVGNEEIYYKRSTNGGINWGADTRLTNNNEPSLYPSVAVSGSNVYVVWFDNRDGNSEIYFKRNPTGNPVGINNISSEIPSSYSLSQNYPNPFNPTTKIRFDVGNGFPVKTSGNDKVGDFVMLKVYDVMGREVQTLVNERLQPGTYEASFDGSQLTSGIYFYKLMTESFTETKRMILIK